MPRAEPVPAAPDVELVPLATDTPAPSAEPDEITVCPHCEEENKVAAQLIGTNVYCGHCRLSFKAVVKAVVDEPELYATTESFVNVLRLIGAIVAAVAFLIGIWAGYDYGLMGFVWVAVPTAVTAALLELVFRIVLLLVDVARNVNRFTARPGQPAQLEQFEQPKTPSTE